MKQYLYEYRDYKRYLRDWGNEQPRGAKTALAEAANCQLAYLTQVLNGKAHLGWEQAEGISRFFGHSESETQYFLLLIELSRASTSSLRSFIERQLDQIRTRHTALMDRSGIKNVLSKEDQATYYSAWYFAAIHIMLALPEFRKKDAIARYLGLPIAKVSEVLDFLVSVGIATQQGNEYRIGKAHTHLEKNSPLISKHHTNWRFQAVRSLERGPSDDMHYSVVFTLSKEDVEKVRSMLLSQAEKVLKVVTETQNEEVAYSLTMDLFQI